MGGVGSREKDMTTSSTGLPSTFSSSSSSSRVAAPPDFWLDSNYRSGGEQSWLTTVGQDPSPLLSSFASTTTTTTTTTNSSQRSTTQPTCCSPSLWSRFFSSPSWLSSSSSSSCPSPSPSRPFLLSTVRQKSSIPSVMGEWYFPSPAQFYDAMQKKGHTKGICPEDASVVVAIHNAVNERAWQEILAYEQLHRHECDTVKLQRFQGRPGDISPKARWRQLQGYGEPFDRHDWYVDRCGKTVKYVIDFYDGASAKEQNYVNQTSKQQDVCIYIDARPALQSLGAIWDRLRKRYKWNSTTLPPPPP